MNPILTDLTGQVTRTTTVAASAKVLIDGFAVRMTDAVAKALANGASEAELAPVRDEINALNQSSTELAAAVEANTSAVPSSSRKS